MLLDSIQDTPIPDRHFAPGLTHKCAASKTLAKTYNPANPVIETKRINGKPAHRVEGMPEGAWLIANTEIDAMLKRVMAVLDCTRTAIYDATGLSAEAVTRCRQGTRSLSDQWIIRLSDYSGIPIAELRQVACVEPVVHAHHRARGAA